MRPRLRLRIAWALFGVSLVGWPVSALTVARDEPQIVLALSWLAIALTSLDVIFTADVRVEQEDGDEGGP